MRVEHGHWTTAGSFARGDQVAGGVVTNLELVLAQQAFDKLRAFLFLF